MRETVSFLPFVSFISLFYQSSIYFPFSYTVSPSPFFFVSPSFYVSLYLFRIYLSLSSVLFHYPSLSILYSISPSPTLYYVIFTIFFLFRTPLFIMHFPLYHVFLSLYCVSLYTMFFYSVSTLSIMRLSLFCFFYLFTMLLSLLCFFSFYFNSFLFTLCLSFHYVSSLHKCLFLLCVPLYSIFSLSISFLFSHLSPMFLLFFFLYFSLYSHGTSPDPQK